MLAAERYDPFYPDYQEEERTYLNSERYQKDAAFWREQFASLPELTGIKARKARVTNAAARNTYVLPCKLCHKIHEHSERSGTPGLMIFISAFFIYLNRITGCEDAVIGIPVCGQDSTKTADRPVSVLPFRFRVDADNPYDDFTQDLRECWLRILRHHRYPSDEILRDMRERFGNVEHLYDLMFSYQNAPLGPAQGSDPLASYGNCSGVQHASLTIHIEDHQGEGQITIAYDYLTDLFAQQDIDALHDHYIRLLWHALDAPQKKIAKIEMVSAQEKSLLLHTFNDTAADFPHERTMLDFFEERAAYSPDAEALLFNGGALTYGELNARANALARQLQLMGARHGNMIALMLHRSFEMMVGMLAIWKAGGAYLPLDPDDTLERSAAILQDSGAQILLTASSMSQRPDFAGKTLQIDRMILGPAERPAVTLAPHDVAYVIYSGDSNGQVKGVMVEHQALVNRINWMNRKYPLAYDDIILQKTTYTFDVSVWELVWWFFAGVKLAFLEPDAENHPDKLLEVIAAYKITTLHFVPSMLSAFLRFVGSHQVANHLVTLRQAFVSGEVLTYQQVHRFHSLIGAVSGARLHHLYGPTEAAIDVTYYDCPAEPKQRVIPIGKPIDNIRLYILDRYLNSQPIGAPGELYIGGVGLARGYLNQPELTAEKFVPNPFAAGERLYKTGDLARWLPQGDIEYLGRIDQPIRIHGFRIGLAEIKYCLEQVPSVLEATVVCRDGARGGPYLAAYYVANLELPPALLHDFLAQRLPEYWIPSYFTRLEHIPLFRNGKANLGLLPAPAEPPVDTVAQQATAPHDQVEALHENGEGGILSLLAGEEGAELSYLLCPYGGGGAYSYLDLACSLAAQNPGCDVYSLNLPGHDCGVESGDLLSVWDAASLILKEAADRIRGRMVIYAHGTGAALGVELTRLFGLAGAEVEALFVGGILPPAYVGAYGWFFDPWIFAGDEQDRKSVV